MFERCIYCIKMIDMDRKFCCSKQNISKLVQSCFISARSVRRIVRLHCRKRATVEGNWLSLLRYDRTALQVACIRMHIEHTIEICIR